ncbi:hypothetical protein HMPREF9374_3223 [Desmospora sp. 8437]|nr:hypothetical protein HMPREF9374_3223 [Desmospora sp. 8437]
MQGLSVSFGPPPPSHGFIGHILNRRIPHPKYKPLFIEATD